MIIKLTNATEEFFGNKVLINPRYIVAVYNTTDKDGSLKTFIYTATQVTYEVCEGVDKIYEMVEECSK